MQDQTKQRILLLFLIPIIGFLSCITAYLVIHGIILAGNLLQRIGPYYLLLPLGFYGSYRIHSCRMDGIAVSSEKIMDMLHRSRGNVSLYSLPYRLGSFALTVLTGGSVGKAGPSAQIGAGISNGILRLKPGFFTNFQKEILILCGISGGFTAVFGTPVFASVFANKIIWTNKDTYKHLLPSFAASFSGLAGLRALGMGFPTIHTVDAPMISSTFILHLIAFGLFISVMAFIFIALVSIVDTLFNKYAKTPISKALIGGGALLLLILATKTTEMLGLGQEILYSTINGDDPQIATSFLKMAATALTFPAGGQGGILSPIFIIGSSAGSLFSQISGLSSGLYAKLGMVGLFAATTNAPLAAIALSLELFGMRVALPGFIVITISYNLVRRFSVFSSQVKKLYSKVDNIRSK